MTQTSLPAWCETLQTKLMAALDAVWATLETSDDPAAIRRARDRAKAIGDLAAVARKVAAMTGSPGRAKPPVAASLAGPIPAWETPVPAPPSFAEPVAAQVEHARRALDRLKGGRRGRL
ncbi:hypothetical protein ASD79_05745 [Caulobacter sp. Root655]|uniref:hypothetical protein n=1 Tax=Caulobacter sp. Root655 TaxID=1736578 RepID=UPI0006F35A4F|nr:hypothetical protein [Caulobacter sp. Root655]KRA61618.1 hypothetical protein ASD79_05745 [Caulobacter sp. Root655]